MLLGGAFDGRRREVTSFVAEGEQPDDPQLPPGVPWVGAGRYQVGLILHAHILNHPGYGPPIAAPELGSFAPHGRQGRVGA